MQTFLPENLTVNHIHLVGIGGTGMCGIAEVLHHLGYRVTGSDIACSASVERLVQLGIAVQIGHEVKACQQADIVVVSTAISSDNQEVCYAKQHGIVVIPRAQMLAELMRFRYGIAVAGTHGKTTTTSLMAHVFATASLDPTFVIGGRLNHLGGNAQLGEGEYFIAEADESDASFLHLHPMIAVVTNIDADHMDTYENSQDKLRQAFHTFLHNLPFSGVAVMCLDDPGTAALAKEVARKVVTYGFAPESMVRASDYCQEGLLSHFTLYMPQQEPVLVQLTMPGKHNVLNALAVVAVAHQCGIDSGVIAKGLSSFPGIGRRSEVLGDVPFQDGVITLVDDYGHHPVEIAVTHQAMHDAFPDRRLVWLYQPHRYSRTLALFDDLVSVLSKIDVLGLFEVYASGEAPIEQASSQALSRAIRQHGGEPVCFDGLDAFEQALAHFCRPGDVVVVQGAGDIGQLPKKIMQWLGK